MTEHSAMPDPSTGSSRTDEALQVLGERLGPSHVLWDAETLETYAASTAALPTRPRAVVRPGSTEEVVAVVEWANHHRLPLYPISCGHNWGYGDACAPTPDQVIVDLGRMNRIRELDEEMAYCVVEPGVTQGQLAAHLRERNLPLWMDCTGAGPDTSLVGNVVERGFGHSPYGNRFQTVAGLEVVLGNGRVLRTGFGHFDQARTAHLYPFGIGPYLDGLFTQSNLGIVTSLGLWLMPASECVHYFLCFVDRHEDVAPVVDALRPLRMSGNLRSVVHVANDLRLISGGMTYPRELAGDQGPLPEEVRRRLRAEAGIGAWTVTGALHGTRRQVAAARSAFNKALKGPGRKIVYLTEWKLDLGERVTRWLTFSKAGRKLRDQVTAARSLYDMNRGVPNGRFLAGSYWRHRSGLPANFPEGANPALEGCGMLWIAPILPARGSDVLELHDRIIAPLFQQYGFDLFATLSLLNERSLGGVFTVAYDKDDPEETQRALACYQAVLEAVIAAGYPPYRIGVQSMDHLTQGSTGFWNTVATLKEAVDPHGVIAPGRYDPLSLL